MTRELLRCETNLYADTDITHSAVPREEFAACDSVQCECECEIARWRQYKYFGKFAVCDRNRLLHWACEILYGGKFYT